MLGLFELVEGNGTCAGILDGINIIITIILNLIKLQMQPLMINNNLLLPWTGTAISIIIFSIAIISS